MRLTYAYQPETAIAETTRRKNAEATRRAEEHVMAIDPRPAPQHAWPSAFFFVQHEGFVVGGLGFPRVNLHGSAQAPVPDVAGQVREAASRISVQ
jgi:hypothetical protein